jgi:transposase-like protein
MEKRFLEDCLAKRMSLEAIGAETGRHPSTVSYWLKKHGLVAVNAEKHSSKSCCTHSELQGLVEEGLAIEGIAKRLGIGSATARRWLKQHGLRTRAGRRRDALRMARKSEAQDIQAPCPKHGSTRHLLVAGEARLRCAKCRAEAVSRRRRKVKEILVAEAGGHCVICGYSRHMAALQFHHLDPSSKSFGLGVRGITRSLESLRKEAAKCVLLCANCHAEVEVGATQLPGKVPVARTQPNNGLG